MAVGLSEKRHSNVRGSGGNAKGLLVRQWGGTRSKKVSVSSRQWGCTPFGGHKSVRHGDFGPCGDTLALVLLLRSTRCWGSSIGIGWSGRGARLYRKQWLGGKKLCYGRIFPISPLLALLGSGMFGGVANRVVMPFLCD